MSTSRAIALMCGFGWIWGLALVTGCAGIPPAQLPDGGADGAVDPDSAVLTDALATDAGLPDGASSDAAPPDAFVATVDVPMREALLIYARNNFGATTDTDALTPYLAYVDQQGQVLEPYLYDTFVFLDIDLIVTDHPTVEAWRHFLDSFFDPTPSPRVARPEVTQRGDSQGALLSGNGQAVTQSGIPVTGGGTYAWEVFTRASAELAGSEALVGIIVRDAQTNPIETGVTGLTWSTSLSQWYRYLPSATRWRHHHSTFTLPAAAASVDLQIRQFNAPGEQIWVDRIQLQAGPALLPFENIIAAGYHSLVSDGDFDSGANWSGFVPGDGLERGLYIREANKNVAQGPFPVSGGTTYTLTTSIRADQASASHEALLGIRIFDSAGGEIISDVTGLSHSTYARPPMHYVYAEATTSWTTAHATFTLPTQAATLEVYLVGWSGDGVWFDQVQLVEGATPLSESALKAAGYQTLIHDGSAETWPTTAWWVSTDQPLPSGSGLAPGLARVASSLEDTRKRNVILGLPVSGGMSTHTEFGEIDGQWIDLTVEADRQTALAWFMDEAVSRWSAAPPPGLNLVGFYWMHETQNQDPDLAAFAQGHAESHGLLLTSSPYRMFYGSTTCFGSSYNPDFSSHFHRVWQQPNVWPPARWSMTEAVWNNVHTCLCDPVDLNSFLNLVGYPPCELATVDTFIDQLQTDCAAISSTAQVHANIEWVPGLEPSQGYGRVQDYLNNDDTLGHDFGRFPDRMWYEDGGFGRRCALDPDPVFRAQYDAVHDFIEANRARHGFPSP